ncbi:hypothetical protein V7968_17690 [Nocardia vulneris]|uniref:hypothetical protein n=1 Tax=Nocardia vulneris TaxID=1141657 RepID=UPI0030CC304E
MTSDEAERDRRWAEDRRRQWEAFPEEKELDLALGLMVHQAGMFEFFLHQLIRNLMEGKYAALTTAAMQPVAVLDAIKRICDAGAVNEAGREQIADFVPRGKAAFGERNKYVHGLRMHGDSLELWTNNRRSGGFDSMPLESERLMSLARKFGSLSGEIFDWQRVYIEGKPPRRNARRANSDDLPTE